MIYRPPYKGIWKQFSLFIVAAIVLNILILFFIILSKQKKINNVRHKSVNGIILNKRNLHRGDFSFIIKSGNVIEEYDMAGYDYFFWQLKIGDSLSKKENTYQFDVFRKFDSLYKFVVTIGYE